MRISLFFTILFSYTITCIAISAKDSYIFRKIDYRLGLSNSAVLSLFQDNEGLMWLGTYDGVNCYDGTNMDVYRSDFSVPKTLNSNIIHSIQQADSNCLWITTHLGTNRFSKDTRSVIRNFDLGGDFVIHSNRVGNTWALGYGWIAYYNTYHHRFINIPMPDIQMLHVDSRAFVTDEGELYLFPNNSGILYNFTLNAYDCDSLQTKLKVKSSAFHSKPIDYICYQNGIFCFYDSDKDLFVYDISRKSKIYIRNISEMVQKYGNITGIVPFYEDIMIAFQTNGLIRLSASKKYAEEIIDRNIRIFSIYNDPRQGILWIASDGQGAILYSKKHSIATNIMLRDLSANLSRQVRSILTDKYGGLWVGTKGDGLIHIKNYQDGVKQENVEIYSPVGKQYADSYTKRDREFQVFSMTESHYRNGFWVGAGEPLGLCYYSFDTGRIDEISYDEDKVDEIHSIYEANDSTLYVTSSRYGFCKIILDRKVSNKSGLKIKSYHRYNLIYDQQVLNLFYGMVPQGDSLLWLGSRHKGLVRFNRNTEEYKVFSLSDIVNKSVDDVLCLHWYKDNELYVGTTSGLLRVRFVDSNVKVDYIGREQGLQNDMIHSILEDEKGFLWLGTNKGLIKFNPVNSFSHAYYYSGGVEVGEFSDDAYYKCPYTSNLFFGGIDGLLYLDKKESGFPEFYPEILLRKLIVDDKSVSLQDYYYPKQRILEIEGSSVSFSLSFVVPDYTNAGDMEYSYILEGIDKDWRAFSNISEASYQNVPAGKYIFRIRYKKDVLNTEYKMFTMSVNILPPWYLTKYAYVAYILLFIILSIYVYYILRRYKTKNISYEVNNISIRGQEQEALQYCTIIYNVCDRLRNGNLSSQEYTENLNLIHESIMSMLFSHKISSEYFQMLPNMTFTLAAHLYIRRLFQEILFILEKENHIISHINVDVSDEYSFPTYKNTLRCVFYLVFYYVSIQNDADVSVTVQNSGDKMVITLHSSSCLIRDLCSILSENEVTLIKCNDSDEQFRIRTIQCFVLSLLKKHSFYLTKEDNDQLSFIFEPVSVVSTINKPKKSILMLEDREEMEWLMSSLLVDEYEISIVRNIQEAFEHLHTQIPTLFMADMSMFAETENSLLRFIDKNRSILSKVIFIPMLTWNVNPSVQKQLILLADSFVVLPYDIPFLKEVIHKAIYGKEKTDQMNIEELDGWNTSIVCTTTEQATFIQKFLHILNQNIDREDLGSTFIAEKMLISPRQFYRQIKEISGMPPSDLIKDYRMEKAAKLLRDETLSIQEVISSVGISSRAYFYKEFTHKFGITPKVYRERLKNNPNDDLKTQ